MYYLYNNLYCKYLIILFSYLSLLNCKSQENIIEYPDNIGDIKYNSNTDNKDFKLCNSSYTHQYFHGGKGFQYKGEKIELENTFFNIYKNQNLMNETGLIRIQFIVNCDGETDRFRIISMDSDYNKKIFNEKIISQLLFITKNLKGWIPKENKDYYQYLIFKIKEGNLIEILP